MNWVNCNDEMPKVLYERYCVNYQTPMDKNYFGFATRIEQEGKEFWILESNTIHQFIIPCEITHWMKIEKPND